MSTRTGGVSQSEGGTLMSHTHTHIRVPTFVLNIPLSSGFSLTGKDPLNFPGFQTRWDNSGHTVLQHTSSECHVLRAQQHKQLDSKQQFLCQQQFLHSSAQQPPEWLPAMMPPWCWGKLFQCIMIDRATTDNLHWLLNQVEIARIKKKCSRHILRQLSQQQTTGEMNVQALGCIHRTQQGQINSMILRASKVIHPPPAFLYTGGFSLNAPTRSVAKYNRHRNNTCCCCCRKHLKFLFLNLVSQLKDMTADSHDCRAPDQGFSANPSGAASPFGLAPRAPMERDLEHCTYIDL